jgi:16S rRNA (uracil1498-N3)-methyltransferase
MVQNLKSFIEKYPDTYMFNFSQNNITNQKNDIKTIVLGCEGGFSKNEVDLLPSDKIVGIDSNLILRSETAAVTIASILMS